MWQFPLNEVRSVLVRAGGGDDVVDLAAATFALPAMVGFGPTTVPSRIDAGIGDDVVYGGASRDFIVDRFGNDRIDGGDGDDWIDGGWGDDVLHGGVGNDFVLGSFGNDTVGGDAGDDRLYGGPGNDFLGSLGFGPRPTEPGNDLLVGGSGKDRLVGGEGKDLLFGGSDRDHFSRADDETEMLDRTPDEPIDIVLPV
jgi:Ca2+-binding RTX toxin-like protein